MGNLELAHKAADSKLFSGVELSLGITGRKKQGSHVHIDEAKRRYIWTEGHDGKFTPGLPPLPK